MRALLALLLGLAACPGKTSVKPLAEPDRELLYRSVYRPNAMRVSADGDWLMVGHAGGQTVYDGKTLRAIAHPGADGQRLILYPGPWHEAGLDGVPVFDEQGQMYLLDPDDWTSRRASDQEEARLPMAFSSSWRRRGARDAGDVFPRDWKVPHAAIRPHRATYVLLDGQRGIIATDGGVLIEVTAEGAVTTHRGPADAQVGGHRSYTWLKRLQDGRFLALSDQGFFYVVAADLESSVALARAHSVGEVVAVSETVGPLTFGIAVDGSLFRLDARENSMTVAPGLATVSRAGFVDHDRLYFVDRQQNLSVETIGRPESRVRLEGDFVDAVPFEGGLLAVDSDGWSWRIDVDSGSTEKSGCVASACSGGALFPSEPVGPDAIEGYRTALARWFIAARQGPMWVRLGVADGHLLTAEVLAKSFAGGGYVSRNITVWKDGEPVREWTIDQPRTVWLGTATVRMGVEVRSVPGLEPVESQAVVSGGSLALEQRGDEGLRRETLRVGTLTDGVFVPAASWPYSWKPPVVRSVDVAVNGDRFLYYGRKHSSSGSGTVNVWQFRPDGVVRSAVPGVVAAPPPEKMSQMLRRLRTEAEQGQGIRRASSLQLDNLVSGLPTPVAFAEAIDEGPVVFHRGSKPLLLTDHPWPDVEVVRSAEELKYRRNGLVAHLAEYRSRSSIFVVDEHAVLWTGRPSGFTPELVAAIVARGGHYAPEDDGWKTLLATPRATFEAAEREVMAGALWDQAQGLVREERWQDARQLVVQMIEQHPTSNAAQVHASWVDMLDLIGAELPLRGDRIVMVTRLEHSRYSGRATRHTLEELRAVADPMNIQVLPLQASKIESADIANDGWEAVHRARAKFVLVDSGKVIWVGDSVSDAKVRLRQLAP